MKQVVVIGGGATGLAAAHALEEAKRNGSDLDYVLFEQDHRLGGKILTYKMDGFTVESGSDCFISHKPQVIQMADKLDFGDLILGTNDASKRTYVFADSRLHKLPDGMLIMIPAKILPFAISPLISWPGKARMLLDLIIPRKTDDKEETVTEFVTRRLGREALDKIAEPLIAGIHAGDPDTMSINGMQMMLNMEKEHGSLIKAMIRSRKRPPGAPKDWKPGMPSYIGKAKIRQTFFMSFVEGMQSFTEALADSADRSKIHSGKTVTRVDKHPEGGWVVLVEGMDPIRADAVIVAAPADSAARLLARIDSQVLSLLQTVPHISSATVSLAYPKSAITDKVDGFGFVVPLREQRKIMAVTYSSIKWNFRTPDDSKYSLMRAFVGGAKNQHLVELDDKDMLDMVLTEVSDILGVREKPVLTKIQRWFNGMPQYNVGHNGRMAKLMEHVAKHDGLFLAGAAYAGVGVPDCVKGGLAAADKAIHYLNDKVPAQTVTL